MTSAASVLAASANAYLQPPVGRGNLTSGNTKGKTCTFVGSTGQGFVCRSQPGGHGPPRAYVVMPGEGPQSTTFLAGCCKVVDADLRRHDAIRQRPLVIRRDRFVSMATLAGVACDNAQRRRPPNVSSRDGRTPEGKTPIELAKRHILANRNSCRGAPILATGMQATGVCVHDPHPDQNGEQARDHSSARFCPAPMARQLPDVMLVRPRR